MRSSSYRRLSLMNELKTEGQDHHLYAPAIYMTVIIFFYYSKSQTLDVSAFMCSNRTTFMAKSLPVSLSWQTYTSPNAPLPNMAPAFQFTGQRGAENTYYTLNQLTCRISFQFIFLDWGLQELSMVYKKKNELCKASIPLPCWQPVNTSPVVTLTFGHQNQ